VSLLRTWAVLAAASLSLAALVAGVVVLRDARTEQAIVDCILASPIGADVPRYHGEPLLHVDVLDLVVYRRTEIGFAGERTEAVSEVFDTCRDAPDTWEAG
jgi:hypothetical protein